MSYDFLVKIERTYTGEYIGVDINVIQNNDIIFTAGYQYSLNEQMFDDNKKDKAQFISEIKEFLRDIKNNRKASLDLAEVATYHQVEEAIISIVYKNNVLTIEISIDVIRSKVNIYLTEENLKETITNLKNNFFEPLISVYDEEDENDDEEEDDEEEDDEEEDD